jgi:hypothetical protein
VTILDGEVVRGSVTHEIEEFSPEMWEPFAEWVSTAYPDDAAVMYEDGSYTACRSTMRRSGSGGGTSLSTSRKRRRDDRSVEARRDLASYPVALGSR